MNFLIAPDSFKGSMTALEAAFAIQAGIKNVSSLHKCILAPMADGGEGTSECLMYDVDSERIECKITNHAGEEIIADFGWLPKTKTAIIEVAKACGITLIPENRRNISTATTFGVGELILNALKKGCREIVLTLGGTGTNDGGSGMIKALGGRLLDSNNKEILQGCIPLNLVKTIDISNPKKLLKGIKITVLCDVNNKLLGINGATYVFSPQKGATEDMLGNLEAAMQNYASKMNEVLGYELSEVAGTGAAGGLGFGIMAISNASFVSGAEYVMKALQLEKKIAECDCVITGEGSIDTQSLSGKVPVSIAKLAKEYEKPVIVFAGRVLGNLDDFYDVGITAVLCILQGVTTIEQAMNNGAVNLENTVRNIVKIIGIS